MGVTVTGGRFSVLLGSVVPLDASLFNQELRWLGITVGADPEISPTTRLVSVPFSFKAEVTDSAIIAGFAYFADSAGVADELDSLSSEDFSRTGHAHGWTDDGTVVRLDTSTDLVGIGTANPTEKLDVAGNIKASGTIQSGTSIIIDGVNDKITASGGTIDFDDENLVTTGKATIGPGHTNTGTHAFVAGDSNTASGTRSTVGGGRLNTASGTSSTVGGGFFNAASGEESTVSGGVGNTASNFKATVGGGWINEASGTFSTVSGGYRNTASREFSVAMGAGAKAQYPGSIVIAASNVIIGSPTSDSIASGGNEQLVIRADGGLYLTNVAEATAPYDPSKLITTRGGAYLSGNGTAWTNASDKNQKENFTDVDSEELLEKISELPISRWNYKEEDETVTHIGPMAQDFHALFGVGSDDISISTIDPAGIALAAIKELYEKSKRVDLLELNNKELNQRLEKLEKLIDELSKK